MKLTLFICVFFVDNFHAQSSIFFVPSTDTQEKKSAYLSLESYAHFNRYENGGFQTYGPSLVYGVSKNIEIGANYYFTHDVEGSSSELQPNIKLKIYDNDNKGVAVSTGTVLFIPLNDFDEARTTAMVYAVASKTFRSARELRLTGGVYRQINGGGTFGTKTGALIGVEQPITDRLSFIADWTTGNNRLGYSNIGFDYGIKKSQYLNIGYSFGNSGRANNFLSVFYGFNF